MSPISETLAAQRPRGMVVIVGPDGSGKSTLVAGLADSARQAGVPFRHDHHRPGLLASRRHPPETVTHPQDQSPRGLGMACVKLLTVFVDTVAGWLFFWSRGRRRGVVVVERGWYDMAADPRRYRLPQRLVPIVQALGRLLPRADLVVLMSGDPFALHARKQETSPLEVARAIEVWRRLGPIAGRRLLEVDGLIQSPDLLVEDVWRVLRQPPAARPRPARWKRVPGAARRLDLHVYGSGALDVVRTYRWRARVVAPVRPLLAALGPANRLPADALVCAVALCGELGLRASGLAAMRSSAPGRWVVGVARHGVLDVVLKLGPEDDAGLRREAEVLRALASDSAGIVVPHVVWTGQFGGFTVVATRAVLASRRARLSLDTVGEICTELVRGRPERPPIRHGDLAPWNLITSAGGVVVMDWERAVWTQAPMYDLAHYLMQSGALLGNYRPDEVICLLTRPGSPGWRHLAACGLDPATATNRLHRYLDEAPDYGGVSARFREAVQKALR